MRLIVVLALLAGCGSDNHATGDAGHSDARIDARLDASPDARPDALLDAPTPPAGAHRFVIDHAHLPSNNNEARMYGLDLDGDGSVDNQLGMVVGTFAGMGIPSQPALDHAIDTGAIEILADVEAADLTAGPATVALFDGANAMPAPCQGSGDTVCRKHLAGTATFEVASTSAHDTPLAGSIATTLLDAGPGSVHLRTMFLGAEADLALIGARIRLSQPSDAHVTAGIIAGGISQGEIDATLIPALQVAATHQIALDCSALTSPPGCGCADGSTGKTFIGLFDTNQDCVVSNAEVANNSLIKALLAPDMTIDAMPALSFGVGISAVHAAFTP